MNQGMEGKSIMPGEQTRPRWFLQLLFHPADYFQTSKIKLWHGLMLISILIVTTFFQKILFTQVFEGGKPLLQSLLLSVVNTGILWVALTIFSFAVVSSFRIRTNIWQLAGAVGAASLPLSTANILSCLVMIIYDLIFQGADPGKWIFTQTIIGWLGMAAGWPGYFSYLVLTRFGSISWKWALVISAGAFLLLFIGYWLPVL